MVAVQRPSTLPVTTQAHLGQAVRLRRLLHLQVVHKTASVRTTGAALPRNARCLEAVAQRNARSRSVLSEYARIWITAARHSVIIPITPVRLQSVLPVHRAPHLHLPLHRLRALLRHQAYHLPNRARLPQNPHHHLRRHLPITRRQPLRPALRRLILLPARKAIAAFP